MTEASASDDAAVFSWQNVARLEDVNVNGKRVLIRVDMNVPIENGNIRDDQRIRACLPTLEMVLQRGGSAVLLSHLGRPAEGETPAQFSLEPVGERLAELLGKPVRFSRDYLQGLDIAAGETVLCENVRFNRGEKSNDNDLAQRYAALGEVFVLDAFATAHRQHASTCGVARFAEQACAGLLLTREMNELTKVLETPRRPVLAIVGGAKISSKSVALSHLIDQADSLILGGGIANIFLLAKEIRIGRSLCETELLDAVRKLLNKIHQSAVNLILPDDVVTAPALDDNVLTKVKDVNDVNEDEMILDVGPRTCLAIDRAVREAQTILWSGPMGVFEKPLFANGTQRLAQAVAESDAYSVAGGGDTVAAIHRFGVGDNISYISTGGGAFLQLLEGKPLPAVAALGAKAV